LPVMQRVAPISSLALLKGIHWPEQRLGPKHVVAPNTIASFAAIIFAFIEYCII
jgi:hypothetical protein